MELKHVSLARKDVNSVSKANMVSKYYVLPVWIDTHLFQEHVNEFRIAT